MTADAMADYWVAFAGTGNPNGEGRPQWPVFTAADEQVLEIGDAIEPDRLPNDAALDVFDAVYASLRDPRP